MQTVPLNRLVPSPLNVRSQMNAVADAELKAASRPAAARFRI